MGGVQTGWVADQLIPILMAVASVSFFIVLLRNLIGTAQLLIASRAFASRVRPASYIGEMWTRYGDLAPSVSVIAPCFNEELSVVESIRALLALQYPDHEVIAVNDGSKDRTLEILIEAFDLYPVDREALDKLPSKPIKGCYASKSVPNLLVVDKENGRKADAVNAGISYSARPLICVIDADSIIEPDGLLRATEPFLTDDGQLVAVGGAIRIANGSPVRGGHIEKVQMPKGWLPRFQILEYLRAFLTARIANTHLDMLMLISGAFGIFRRDVLVEIGGYRHDSLAEDLELVTRMHRHLREQKRPYKIEFVPEVVCWTEAPWEFSGLKNQRARWEQGALQTLLSHRKMLFNPRYGRIGLFGMPMIVLEDVLGPPMELIGYLVVILLWVFGVASTAVTLAFLAVTLIFGTALSIGTLILEEIQLRRTPSARDLMTLGLAALVENFGYRQLNMTYRLLGMYKFVRKNDKWAAVPRAGFHRAS